jgi:hypothetical protein
MVVRFYSSTAAETILSGTINNAATTINVADVTGFPVSYPYTLALDYESASEELVDVTAAAGTSLTITRAVDGTNATSHSAGARVRHVSSARDYRDSRNHENAVAGVHGVTGNVVGTTDTQTLSNKTLNNATGSLNRVDIFSEGATGWTTTVYGDADFGTTNLFQWKNNPASTHEVARIAFNGALFIRNIDAAADSDFATSRIRITKDDGSTNIFYVQSGGDVRSIIDTGRNGFTAQPRTDNSTNRAFGVRNAADSANLFVVFQDGRTNINATNPALTALDVKAAAGQSVDIMRVLNSAAVTQFSIQSSGRTLANRGLTVAQPGVLTGAVLQVGGPNTGYSGNLTQWVSGSNLIVASVNQSGVANFANETASSGATSTSGWSVTGQTFRRTAGVTYVNITWTRTGSDINIPASGNITPDLQIGGVPAGWHPSDSLYVGGFSGIGDGGVRMNPDNTVDLLNWTPGGQISNGENIRVAYTFIN